MPDPDPPQVEFPRWLDPAERAALHARVARLPNYHARAIAYQLAPTVVVLVVLVGVAVAVADGTVRGTALVVAQVTWTASVLLAARLVVRAWRRRT
jgi:hypothetical protein